MKNKRSFVYKSDVCKAKRSRVNPFDDETHATELMMDDEEWVTASTTFFEFAERKIEQLNNDGRYGTARNRNSVIRRFREFRGGKDCFAWEMTPEMMEKFERKLKAKGNCRNTTSFYLRTLRTIYNQTLDLGLAHNPNIFNNVYTGIDKTSKRAIKADKISNLRNMNVKVWEKLEFTRDLFMFSFYTRGMSFIDMAFLRKTDLRDGVLTYCRHKTLQLISIKWEKEMDDIVKRHPSDNEFLLPLIRGKGDEFRKYRNAMMLNNRRLKLLGRMLHLETPISFYTARHSWATIAHHCDIPISVISRALGHSSERNTQIYLESIQSEQVDEANRKIIRLL